MTKITSDGGSTSYYELPAGATELNDLIEHKNMSFALGNIFKACYRFGEKDAADKTYDLKKIIFFANRLLGMIEKDKKNNLRENVKYEKYKSGIIPNRPIATPVGVPGDWIWKSKDRVDNGN